MTQIQSLLDVTLLLDCLNFWMIKVLWFHVQVWKDLLSSLIIPVCLLPVLIIISGTWLRWKKMSSQMLQSPSCLVGYLKPHSHFKPSCTHFTQQKFTTDGMMGICSLRCLCWWGDSGKYKAPVTAFADRGTFEYLLPLSRVRLSSPVTMHFLTLSPVSRDMTTHVGVWGLVGRWRCRFLGNSWEAGRQRLCGGWTAESSTSKASALKSAAIN